MAAFIHRGLAMALLLAPVGQLPAATPRPPQPPGPSEPPPILLDAQSSEIDYGNNDLLFRKVKISQGTMSVIADQARANGLDFDNSHWVFKGNVKIDVNEGELTSDEAQITFVKKLLATANVTGDPAEFVQHEAKSGRPVQGSAYMINYNVGNGVIELEKDAWLSDGQNEIRGESLKYNIAARRVIANAADQKSQRVHITITPPPPAKRKP